ncbi:hypothetical protein J4P02_23215 [Pseudomonas sp. NFXW11]|uniref:hypothetical protein n=1 Tax=Pseudomonas sp. NFXW11 TaxID=2819531 RepID=UPI003CE7566D
MRMTLSALPLEPADSSWVAFSCAFGSGRGRWRGSPTPLGQEQEVEISVDDQLHWNRDLRPSSANTPSLQWEQDQLRICGQLLQVDEDGVAALALGPSIILLALQGRPEQLPLFVELCTRQVQLYPVEV